MKIKWVSFITGVKGQNLFHLKCTHKEFINMALDWPKIEDIIRQLLFSPPVWITNSCKAKYLTMVQSDSKKPKFNY